jgi:VWFA-related protein
LTGVWAHAGIDRGPPHAAVEPIRYGHTASDGDTSISLDGISGAVALAGRSRAAVYTIGLMGEQPLHETQEPALSLRRLAAITGGRAFFPESGRRLASLYNQIYEELSQQYTIGYVSTNSRRDGGWRNITVSVKRPHTSARTKQGYFAPDP